MKILVIQEQHFVEMPNGEVWVDQQSGQDFWQRYLNVFDEVVVCARMEKSDVYKTDGLIRSDRPEVTFIGMPNFRGVFGLIKNILNILVILHGAMKMCDRIIFRAPSPISMVAYPLACFSGKPYAAEIMNNPATQYSPESSHHFYTPLIQKFIVWQTKSLCRNANGVSYVTEYTLQNMYPSHARIKGFSKEYFEGSYSTINLKPEQYHFEEWKKEKPDKLTLIHTGKMNDNRKGQDILIDAVKILNDRSYNVHCIFVGDGDLRVQFEDYGKQLGIRDKLDFVGWKAGFSQIQEQLLRAQIAVFPSLGEGLPRSTIEAMASGLLCFGSRIDGMVELLDDSLLVDDFDGKSFADKIEYYLIHWNLVEQKRHELYNKGLSYSSDKLEIKRKEFYKKLLYCDIS
ncbi:MAG: glycosyltransferase [Eubacterium sp.]|nr:glycosyltransferase [Eubacterium sp.]